MATVRKTKVQGLDCYLPALAVQDGEYKTVYTSHGDPLVTRQAALKYARIWKNESDRAGYVTYF